MEFARPLGMPGDLTDPLEAIVRDHPDQAAFARKIRELISRIRSEFDGEVREQLEQVVEETVQRQATILENNDRSLEALAKYRKNLDQMVARLSAMLPNIDPDGDLTIH